MPSLEPAKPSTEQLKDQLSDKQRAIFDFLRANPGRGYTYSEIGELLDMSKHTVRKWIVERGMVDNSYRMNGSVFDGVVTHERKNNAKYWYIRPEVEERLDEPQEVPRFDSLLDFATYVAKFEAVYVVAVGLLLLTSETLFDTGLSNGTMVSILVLSSLGVLVALVGIGYHEVEISN